MVNLFIPVILNDINKLKNQAWQRLGHDLATEQQQQQTDDSGIYISSSNFSFELHIHAANSLLAISNLMSKSKFYISHPKYVCLPRLCCLSPGTTTRWDHRSFRNCKLACSSLDSRSDHTSPDSSSSTVFYSSFTIVFTVNLHGVYIYTSPLLTSHTLTDTHSFPLARTSSHCGFSG